MASDRVESYSGPARTNPPPADEDVLDISEEPSQADSIADEPTAASTIADEPTAASTIADEEPIADEPVTDEPSDDAPPERVSVSDLEFVDSDSAGDELAGPRSVEEVVEDLQAIAMQELERLEDEPDARPEDAKDDEPRDLEAADEAAATDADEPSDEAGDDDGDVMDLDPSDPESVHDQESVRGERKYLPPRRPALPGGVSRRRESDSAADSDPPSLGSLQQTTLASVPPPIAGKMLEPDELLTDSHLYDEMLASMAPPVRVPLDIDLSSDAAPDSQDALDAEPSSSESAYEAGALDESEPPSSTRRARSKSKSREGRAPAKKPAKEREKGRRETAPPPRRKRSNKKATNPTPVERPREARQRTGSPARPAAASSDPPREEGPPSVLLASLVAFGLGIAVTLGAQQLMGSSSDDTAVAATDPQPPVRRPVGDSEPTDRAVAGESDGDLDEDVPAADTAAEPADSAAPSDTSEWDDPSAAPSVDAPDWGETDPSAPSPVDTSEAPEPNTAAPPADPPAQPSAEPTAEPSAEPSAAPAGPGPFDKAAASAAVGGAAAAASAGCGDGVHKGSAPVSVTFAPSGRVTVATVGGGPLAGTSVGSCIANTMRTPIIPPFEGGPVTVSKTVTIR